MKKHNLYFYDQLDETFPVRVFVEDVSKFHFTSIHPLICCWCWCVVVFQFFEMWFFFSSVERDKWCFEVRCILLESSGAVNVWEMHKSFTAIYGFEGFVNIILMFNETIINQVVCKSKIATMTFLCCRCLVKFWCFRVTNALVGISMKIRALQLQERLFFFPSFMLCCYCSLKKHENIFLLLRPSKAKIKRKRRWQEKAKVKRTKTIINYVYCITSLISICVVFVTHFPPISNDVRKHSKESFKSLPNKQRDGEKFTVF